MVNVMKVLWLEKKKKHHEYKQREKVFVSSSSFQRYEECHSQKKLFVCKQCKNSFVLSSILKDHGRIHTGKKPYVCKVFEKAFLSMKQSQRYEVIPSEENSRPGGGGACL